MEGRILDCCIVEVMAKCSRLREEARALENAFVTAKISRQFQSSGEADHRQYLTHQEIRCE